MPSRADEQTAIPKIEYPDFSYVIVQENSLLAPKIASEPKNEVLAGFSAGDGINYLLGKLLSCESGDNPYALNPCDTDGTPSYGCLQFKAKTLKNYALRYGMDDTQRWTEDDLKEHLYNCEFEKTIFLRMTQDPEVNFSKEFPACYIKLNNLFKKAGL
jgi:hypothetical protein